MARGELHPGVARLTCTGRSRSPRGSRAPPRGCSTARGAATTTTGCPAAGVPTTTSSRRRWRSSTPVGFLDGGRVNEAGIDYRQSLEDRLDALTVDPWQHLGAERTAELQALMDEAGPTLLARIDDTAGPNWMPAGRLHARSGSEAASATYQSTTGFGGKMLSRSAASRSQSQSSSTRCQMTGFRAGSSILLPLCRREEDLVARAEDQLLGAVGDGADEPVGRLLGHVVGEDLPAGDVEIALELLGDLDVGGHARVAVAVAVDDPGVVGVGRAAPRWPGPRDRCRSGSASPAGRPAVDRPPAVTSTGVSTGTIARRGGIGDRRVDALVVAHVGVTEPLRVPQHAVAELEVGEPGAR